MDIDDLVDKLGTICGIIIFTCGIIVLPIISYMVIMFIIKAI